MRTTTHSGRVGGDRHNDRNFDLERAGHIDSSRSHLNRYWMATRAETFAESERLTYERLYGDMLAKDNAKHLASSHGHADRVKTVAYLLSSKKTMPDEVIFQLGDKDCSPDKDGHRPAFAETQIEGIYREFAEWHDRKFGANITRLDWALHMDETTPHIQERKAWHYVDENGITRPGQEKALQQLGYQLPDPTKPRGKRNNRKMVYTAECRARWIEICQSRGLQIETEPLHRAPSEQNLAKGDYIIRQQEQQLAQQQLLLRQADQDIARRREQYKRDRVIQAQELSKAEQLQQARLDSLKSQEVAISASLDAKREELDRISYDTVARGEVVKPILGEEYVKLSKNEYDKLQRQVKGATRAREKADEVRNTYDRDRKQLHSYVVDSTSPERAREKADSVTLRKIMGDPEKVAALNAIDKNRQAAKTLERSHERVRSR